LLFSILYSNCNSHMIHMMYMVSNDRMIGK
jgi:hypothetical protein